MPLPVVAEVVRSGFVEGCHTGSLVALRADGSRALDVGEPDREIFPRSANKPLQAVAMLRAGLVVEAEQLAVVAASHNGEDYHLGLVRQLLLDAGLPPAALLNTAGWPIFEPAAHARIRSGGGKDTLSQNCSGKHAGMLATCVANGWPIESYLQPAHPLQQAIRATVEDLTGATVAATGVDGCGAPLYAVPLTALARAFARLTMSNPSTPERRVADAMRAHPHAVGGTGRAVTRLMAELPGLLAKDGAEGVFVAATADGAAAAVKIADGAERAATPLLVVALTALGCAGEVLTELASTPVFGGGRRVGEVRSTLVGGDAGSARAAPGGSSSGLPLPK